jgi:cobalt-zinc-cadmium efflux system membrane fusion protein
MTSLLTTHPPLLRWTLPLILPAALLLASGCSRPAGQKAEAAGREPGPERPEARPAGHAPDVVELDAAAQREAGIETAAVVERSIPQVVRANGRLAMNENTTWRVGAVTEGRIMVADVKVGDLVTKGQVLARMHSHDIHESRAAYRKAVGEQARLKANLDFARRNRDRMKRLYDLKAASFEQLDHSENELKNAGLELANADTEVTRTRQHLTEFLEVPLEDPHHPESGPADAQHTLADHVEDLIPVKAPAGGVVVARNVTLGVVAGASSDLFVISDLTTLWALASVQEEDLSLIRIGLPARVFVQAYPDKPFPGRIVTIAEVLDPSTRTVQVRVELDNKAGLLRPEMYSTVELEARGTERALFIRQEATQDVNGQHVVFVRESPVRFAMRPVVVGRTVEGLVQVNAGLKPGEVVVTHGSFVLKSQLLRASMTEE